MKNAIWRIRARLMWTFSVSDGAANQKLYADNQGCVGGMFKVAGLGISDRDYPRKPRLRVSNQIEAPSEQSRARTSIVFHAYRSIPCPLTHGLRSFPWNF